MQNVRVFFSKTGMAKYISHLDLMRCMTRAVKRAGLPVWYTEGFNPHLFMTFALPLSLGVESLCETVDMRLTQEIPLDEVRRQMNDVLPPDIQISKVALPVHKPEEIAFAQFEIRFYHKNPAAFFAELETAFSADALPAEKKAKQGRRKVIKTINLKEYIHAHTLTLCADGASLDVVLSAGSKDNINPALLIETLTRDCGEPPCGMDVCKQQMFCADMVQFE